jgi:putative Mg2+ transporter-C (MgtC) family protein
MWLRIFEGFNIYSVTLRLLTAMALGGIIGIERESKRRAAGFRTYMLVCMGSALAMITNQYISIGYDSDPARLGAQVISGIGFLGAGTILVTARNQVRGLTTAAGLWASACLGLAVGIGFFEGALVAGALILFIIVLMNSFDKKIISAARNIDIYLEMSEGGNLSDVLSFARANAIRVLNVEFTASKYFERERLSALISLRLPKRHLHAEVIEEMSKIEGVHYIEEI